MTIAPPLPSQVAAYAAARYAQAAADALGYPTGHAGRCERLSASEVACTITIGGGACRARIRFMGRYNPDGTKQVVAEGLRTLARVCMTAA